MIQGSAIAIRIAFLFISLYSGMPGFLFGQSSNAAFRNITSAGGLPSTSVVDVTQDAFGFIWIGTWEGDYRYDGRSFTKIPSTTGGRYLTADKKGGVWISFNNSAGYYDAYADSVKHYDIPNADRFPDMAIDDAGSVWAGTTDGVCKFDLSKHQFVKEKGQQEGASFRITARGNGALLFLYRDKNGTLFIGRRDIKGNYSYEPFPPDENNKEEKKTFDAGFPVFLFPFSSTGTLIVNKSGWAYKTERTTRWKFNKPLNNLTLGESAHTIYDGKGNIWLHHENTLDKINVTSGKSTTYTHDPANPNSILPINSVFTDSKMFFDRQGVLWITCYSKGISRLNIFESDFGLLKDSTGSPVLDVLSALEIKDGSFWIGSRTLNNGLLHYDSNGKIIKTYGAKATDSPPGKTVGNELSHPFAWALAESADGSIWVGGGSPGPHRGGLSRIRPGSNQITRFKNDPADTSSIIYDWIGKIYVDGSDRVWLFSRSGVCSIDPATEKITRGIKSESSDTADLTPYWPEFITTTGDIVIRDPEKYTHYIIDHKSASIKPFGIKSTPEDQLRYLHLDEAGKAWFVSSKGFGNLDRSFTSIEFLYDYAKKGAPAENIYALSSDKKGNTWLATDMGIFKFDPHNQKLKHYGFERGLQGNMFSVQLNYKGPSGKIYFGGTGGINIFDPAAIRDNPYPPQMVFTGLKLDGKSIPFGKKASIQQPIFIANKITVDPGILTISIDFAALHFAGNNSNQYQYKLEGFDKAWRDGGTTGNAIYTNLSPGNYTLYIKGSNWDGVWSDGKKSISIVILPPWWKTWWAYTIYALIALFLAWQFFEYQKAKTIRKEREKTQTRELEQAKEIQKAYHELKATQQQLIQSEKMASLGELTAGIAHEIQNPLNFVNNFSEVNKELVEELKGEKSKVKSERDENLENDILNDIQNNLDKIIHHGKRADAIVKGMLLHSRTTTGSKEPTDINALADEYLRLSYHGLRAKDKTFNASIKTDFDESIGIINIIPQDIGRVLLNLYNNAFYAVAEKAKQEIPGYEPTVVVSTKKDGNIILISVKDNGSGIPQKIIDKIFQPFFTTKPTGQGTGLGLSLSYDIVKAHGGEIKVKKIESEGSEFVIQLPVAF